MSLPIREATGVNNRKREALSRPAVLNELLRAAISDTSSESECLGSAGQWEQAFELEFDSFAGYAI
jgi:hypothetical protein